VFVLLIDCLNKGRKSEEGKRKIVYLSVSVLLSRHSLNMRRTILFLVLFGCAGSGHAQRKVEATLQGLISDSATGNVVENVSVFLSGSTYGGSSGSDGRYFFKVSQVGTFQLVFSRVGYDVKVVDIRISKSDTLPCNVSLNPKIILFNEVEVSVEAASLWHRNYQDFLRVFLGSGPYASQCEVKNPDILEFVLDPDSGVLEAKAAEPLLVSNKTLGYELTVSLLEFQWNLRLDYGHFLVYPSFRTMTGSALGIARAREHNRRKAYEGSLRHFLVSIAESKIDSNGFVIHRGELEDLQKDRARFVFEEEIQTEPVEASTSRRWTCETWLRVDHRSGRGEGESYIHTGKFGALIDPTGILEDPRSIAVLGRWSRERMADMLPLDFEVHGEAPARR
jgi:hypothetical protein